MQTAKFSVFSEQKPESLSSENHETVVVHAEKSSMVGESEPNGDLAEEWFKKHGIVVVRTRKFTVLAKPQSNFKVLRKKYEGSPLMSPKAAFLMSI